ncbi:MAG: transcriptional regulator MntR [Candidatus Marinimicrobia bacterium]|nr:transcriptional regulator MntR [Candidatus Neomarinimicrobiota bacterium]|tara:strand:+ start:16885 stop:17298 length:414 start_codon:yes stop_codon:yes gene_type:complete
MVFNNMSFKRVRNAHKTENTEDYLELIAELLNIKGEARIVDIASKIGIAQATANKTIQRLQQQGYIKREPYRSIFLTVKGQKIASKSKKRHNIVLNFLLNLGLDNKTASADAEGIEHHVSDKTLKKMDRFNRSKKYS